MDENTEEITADVDAEFITQLGDELRRRDETLQEFFEKSCQQRLNGPFEKTG